MKQPSKTQWQHYKSVATWIPIDVFERLQKVAEFDNVSVSAYIKAIIVDAVNEQEHILAVNTKPVKSIRVQLV